MMSQGHSHTSEEGGGGKMSKRNKPTQACAHSELQNILYPAVIMNHANAARCFCNKTLLISVNVKMTLQHDHIIYHFPPDLL